MIIDGVKFACDKCIRGHRAAQCEHHDRPLKQIGNKGRPVSQCNHCRSLRQSRAVHTKCTCALSARNGNSDDDDADRCRCYDGSHCICACSSDQHNVGPQTKSLKPTLDQSATGGELHPTCTGSPAIDALTPPGWNQQSHSSEANEIRVVPSIDEAADSIPFAQTQDIANSQIFTSAPDFTALQFNDLGTLSEASHMTGSEEFAGVHDWQNMDHFTNLNDFTNIPCHAQIQGLDDVYQTANAPDFMDAQIFPDTYNSFNTVDFANIEHQPDSHYLDDLQNDERFHDRASDAMFTSWG